MTNINNNNDNWNDEIDDELPSWLSAWDSGSVFGSQSTFLDDVDERESIFSSYANFVDKTGGVLPYEPTGKRYSNSIISDIDTLFMIYDNSKLDFSDTKNTSYSLGRVADQTNGVDLRYNLLFKISKNYEKYVAFALAMKVIPTWTDSLRLSRMAQKDNFDATILPITKEKYAQKFNEKTFKDIREYDDDYNHVANYNIQYPTVFQDFIINLNNYRAETRYHTGLDISLLPVFMASLNAIISQLGDSSKLIEQNVINAINDCDNYMVEVSSGIQPFGKYNVDLNKTRDILGHTNYFNLDHNQLLEMYTKLTDFFNSKYKNIFDKEIHSSDNPIEHLQTCINLSIEWQKIYQEYMKEQHGKSGSKDKFENILKQISMDSRVGSAMSETMSRKISKNATEILDEALEKTEAERTKRATKSKRSASRNNKGFKDSSIYHKDYDVSDHPVPLINIPPEQLTPSYSSPKVNAILDEHKRLQYGQKLGKIGDITNKAWKLNLGNTRVFKVKPRTEAKVRIVVDISGSMGDTRDSRSAISSAFKIANGIQKCFQDVETYMCSVDIDRSLLPDISIQGFYLENQNYPTRFLTGIGKIPNNTMLNKYDRDNDSEHWSRNSSTPLCLGIQEMKNSLIGSYDKSVGIIITDGYPNDSVPRLDGSGKYCDCADHSKDLCHELYNAGTRFGVINIDTWGGYDYSIAPSDCTINIKNVDDDIRKVSNLFNWLLTR
jgi:hypothetical protein